MKKIINPSKNKWTDLMQRPSINQPELQTLINDIFLTVKKEGDSALKKYSLQFDKVALKSILVSKKDIDNAVKEVNKNLQQAIQLAKSNIEKFHRSQFEKQQLIETAPGVKCWRENRAIEKVGIYIPGGSAPLFSTVLMLGVPAKLAGCKQIVLCTPPDKNGKINPAILFSAKLVGVSEVFAVGGAQAIAAMALGTNTIPKTDKIFGPGNQYVTAAKQLAQNKGVAIDMLAGPSEVLIIADAFANPMFVAADLLSQAEHGADSQVILLSNNEQIIDKTLCEIKQQLNTLPRKSIAEKALKNSKTILLNTLEECIEFSNQYAPEHLILAVKNYKRYVKKINNAGSVFLGNYSCESAGDYASGTNHTLPTNGYARSYSGVSLDSFIKKITFQEVTQKGLQNIGKAIELMAEAEQLIAHKNAVSIRLKKTNYVSIK
ncbi:MAG: histidinol dehydrogenase [Bacteroidia bacterium]|nr:histidinol dehydrogenase [Bacteroidia bacterium]